MDRVGLCCVVHLISDRLLYWMELELELEHTTQILDQNERGLCGVQCLLQQVGRESTNSNIDKWSCLYHPLQ